jgi:hypothetical protein
VISALLAGLVAASTPVLPLAGPVSELAADGGRVAILVRTKTGSCARDRVAVWRPTTRSFVPVGASACVGSTSTGAGLFSVGLAGTRVAYVQYAGGNTRELQLRLAALASLRPVSVASASFDVDAMQGTYLGRVAGDGSLLAFDWWSECLPCAAPVAPRGSIFRLVRLDGTLVYSGAFAGLRAARIDARVLLVLTRVGTQSILWTVDVSSGQRSGPWILPAARSAGDDVCGDPSGCRAAALRLADYQDGIAVYVAGRTVHLLRLSDRRDATIRAPGVGPVHAQLEPSGLFYSYSPAGSPGRSRVALVPLASLLAGFPKGRYVLRRRVLNGQLTAVSCSTSLLGDIGKGSPWAEASATSVC